MPSGRRFGPPACLFEFLTENLHDLLAAFRTFQFGFGGLNRAMNLLVGMVRELPVNVLDFVRFVRNQVSVTILIVLSHSSSWHRGAWVGSQVLSQWTGRTFRGLKAGLSC